jgi:hypothetical protein
LFFEGLSIKLIQELAILLHGRRTLQLETRETTSVSI